MIERPIESALRHFDSVAVSEAAKAETRAREHHLPPVSVYRWWARRTEAVSGALLDAVAAETGSNTKLVVADPFVGGGVIALAALLRKHHLYAQDLNPWVILGLETMLSLPSAEQLTGALARLRLASAKMSRRAYATTMSDGAPGEISQSIRVAVACCSACGHKHRLFPHALVSQLKRRETGRPESIIACRHGHLFAGDGKAIQSCPTCGETVDPAAVYHPHRVVTCPACGAQESLDARAANEPWDWELVLVERATGTRRELDFPTHQEIVQSSSDQWKPRRGLGAIPRKGEMQVLARHGFQAWSDLYPARQRYVVERLLKLVPTIAETPSELAALTMAILGSTEMAGHLSRWDRFYLKSYEGMASHRFNLTTLAAEPNVIGAGLYGRGTVTRRVRLFGRAADWFKQHEISVEVSMRTTNDAQLSSEDISGRCNIVLGSSEKLLLPDSSVDLVLTDPPYHDDVQYHDLSLPFRAWAKISRIRQDGEAVAIPHSATLSSHKAYRSVLERIFTEMHRVLKPSGRLIFSYANRDPVAWVNLFAALRSSGLRPLGFSIVHSENEVDHAKRSGRACNLDLILELVRRDACIGKMWRPPAVFDTDEERYLLAVGEAFLRSGDLVENWIPELLKQLRAQPFVRSPEVADVLPGEGPEPAVDRIAV